MLKSIFPFKRGNQNKPALEVPKFSFQQRFDLQKCVNHLDPDLKFLADEYYKKLAQILPEHFSFRADQLAPDDANPTKSPNMKLSVEYGLKKGTGRSRKYGTARIEIRDKEVFVKTVTWYTPQSFLHRREVYDIIKLYYQNSRIFKSKSTAKRGFAIKSPRHIVTVEVFGEGQDLGYLACDITLNLNNKPLAKQRIDRFLEFYGSLYNKVGNSELKFSVQNKLPDELEIEVVSDYQSQQVNQPNSIDNHKTW